jgi:anti-sigma regulatory factor (Ser/Thr protein kinase)
MNNTQSPQQSIIAEQGLPTEVSIRSDTLLNRYRNFPVFSRTWFRYRSLAFGLTLFALFLVMIGITQLVGEGFSYFLRDMVPAFLGGTGLFLIGQSIAVWVRQQQYSVRKESLLISLALLFGVASSAGIVFGARFVAASVVSAKDESHIEKHSKAELSEGKKPTDGSVTATNKTGESESARIRREREEQRGFIAQSFVLFLKVFPSFLVVIYWGSGIDLWVFFRQRKSLAEALRQQELKRAKEAQREAELRLSVLVAQVEPHFLFNTLAGVRSAILTEPLRATAIVDHLVDYLRSTIPQMRGDGSSVQGRLAQQLDAARAYLGLMQARIPRLSFDVESELKDAAFPPLLLISLVENAIKHGVEPKIGPVHISVHARYFEEDNEEKLEVTVADNGVGFGGSTSGSGIGLANIRERLEATYGNRASLTLKARPDGGVAAIIKMPLMA